MRPIRLAPTDEGLDGAHQLPVGAHLLEDRLGYRDAELALQDERELDEIERVGREIVAERHLGREVFRPDAEMVRDQASDVRLHQFRGGVVDAAGSRQVIENAAESGHVGWAREAHRLSLRLVDSG